ncbi:hypothetical protein BDV26DRAFT_256798 [Aspergillus bertholletiae]|uniref:Uncharacterized protein n=1 Tax=Aspergillus bertholletiae TaxID=1226010 RepID=A0A5N7BG08_9EURO|nr:hypothetical protein BDV26DRAFT_256798 [Aspergillus bertholletiae]
MELSLLRRSLRVTMDAMCGVTRRNGVLLLGASLALGGRRLAAGVGGGHCGECFFFFLIKKKLRRISICYWDYL